MRSPRAVWLALVLTAAAVIGPISVSPAVAREPTIRRDLQYTERDGEPRLLDAYLPATDQPAPGVVVIPGGRWTFPEKEARQLVELAEQLTDLGLAAFPMEYTGAKDAPYPAAPEDVQAAVEWIRSNADDLGVDPERLAVMGESAGGHLAAFAGLVGEGSLDEGSRVRAVVSFSGPMDLAAALEGDTPSVLRDAIRNFLGCEADCGELAEEASPINYVDGTDPPVLLANSTEEIIPLDQALAMDAALREAGVEHELVEVPGPLHGFSYFSPVKKVGEGGTIQETVLTFLVAQLTGREVDIPSPSATTQVPPSPGADKPGAVPKGEEAADPEGNIPMPLLVLAILAGLAAAVEAGAIIVLRRQVRELTFALTTRHEGADRPSVPQEAGRQG